MVTIPNSKFQILNSKKGFTLFEVIISIGILVILSSIILQSFLVAKERENTRQAGLNLAAQARQAQTQSLTGQIGSNGVDVYLVGQYLVKDANSSENKSYKILSVSSIDLTFGTTLNPAQINNYGGVKISKIEVKDPNWSEKNSLIIGFQPPRGLVKFYDPDNSGNEFPNSTDARLTLTNTANNETRVLLINNLGQMTLQKP